MLANSGSLNPDHCCNSCALHKGSEIALRGRHFSNQSRLQALNPAAVHIYVGPVAGIDKSA